MKIKIDEAKTLEFKIDTSSGCATEDLQGFLRFNFGGVEYGFPAKITEGCFKVEVPPFKNVVNDQITESISKNKALIVKGRLDVIANKNTYVTPWKGDIDIEVPVSMKISEGGTLDEKKKVTVSDPEKESLIKEFNKLFDDESSSNEAVKVSKFKDVLVEEKDEGGHTGPTGPGPGEVKGDEILVTEEDNAKYKCKPCGWIYDPAKQGKPFSEWDGPCPKCGAPKSKFVKVIKEEEDKTPKPPKKSRFAENLEKAYVKTGV
jgi:rubredoxin